jgi:hypothetical protein
MVTPPSVGGIPSKNYKYYATALDSRHSARTHTTTGGDNGG